jgi:glycosyltransferase involved in cell wall biosynthesis
MSDAAKGLPAVLLSHPTGNQNVRNAAKSFAEHDMLAEFWTTIAWDTGSLWNGLLPEKLKSQLARRSFAEVPRKNLRSSPWRELVRLASRPTPLHKLLASEEKPFSVIGVYRAFDRAVAEQLKRVRPDVVYAYEGGALQTFREAKRLGIKTIFEQPSSYWYWNQQLVVDEAARNPEFASLLGSFRDSEAHLKWKDEEIALADFVFVPSEHVKRTLVGAVPESKIQVINYGAPDVCNRNHASANPGQSLKVLYVGGLQQRKGIGYLLEAIEGLDTPIELTMIGRRISAHPRVDEACKRWRWFESLPHDKVLELMENADVLVHPSLSEGCALVVLEALASGLPVIVTPHSGSLEFVRDGQEGFVVPTCDSGAIADKLRVLMNDRGLLARMSQCAQATARAKSWEAYRSTLADTVRSIACR